jgi:hypothetical protein
VYTADENLNDIREAAPAHRGRENVFARRWGLFSQFAAASVGRHTRHAAWAHNAQAMPDPLGGVSIQSVI